MKIPHVHRKTAKGHTYYYFNTGQKTPAGKPIRIPLGKAGDPAFGRKLADAQRARTMRKATTAEMTVARMADLYEKSDRFRSVLAENSRRNYRIYLDVIRDQMGLAPVDDVKPADVTVMMDKMADRPSAANMAARTLGALYAWGRRRGHTKANPVANVEYLEEGEHEPWPEWLLERALKAEDPLVRLATSLLYYTAQRIGDVVRLRWTDVVGGRVKVTPEKTRRHRVELDFPAHAELVALLAVTPRRGFTILAQQDGRPYRQAAIRRALQAFAAEHGVKIVPHGLRKNAVNALLELGCSPHEVNAITGQSPLVIEHYAKQRDKSRLGDSAVLKWNKGGLRKPGGQT